jgi:glycerol-3-phosphate O-acyltransferase
VATILLATRQRALPEDELLAHIDMFQNIAKMAPYSADARLPNLPAATILEMAERVGRLSRFTHPGGDVIHAVEPQASFITYYRNNVAHLFAVPSAIAFFLQHNDSIREDLIRQGMRVIYPVIKKEFFLRWDVKDIDSVTTQYIGILCDLGLFARSEGGKLTRPEMTSFEFNILRTIGLVIGPALERFAIATHLLKQYDDGLEFKIEDFQRRCVMMAQRISLLTGATDAELPTPQLFSVIFDQLNENGMIKKMTSDTWTLAPAFTEILGLTAVLLSVDMRHSMARAKG